MLKGTAREAAAEFLGTFVLIVFGVGVNAQVLLGGGETGGYLSINIGWGLAVMLGVYVAYGVSGAHINPAVTIALAACDKFPMRKVPVYWLAQVAGALLASAVVYCVYAEALDAYDGGVRQISGDKGTAGIWGTYPREFRPGRVLSTFPGGFVDQAIGTALLMAMILALTDERNTAPKANLVPVLFGVTVMLIGMSFGYNAGYAINPARDFGPRLFTAIAGWGTGVFTVNDTWSWVPIVAPCAGAIAGAYVYLGCIARHHPDKTADNA